MALPWRTCLFGRDKPVILLVLVMLRTLFLRDIFFFFFWGQNSCLTLTNWQLCYVWVETIRTGPALPTQQWLDLLRRQLGHCPKKEKKKNHIQFTVVDMELKLCSFCRK
ncbi:hypothetical protein EUGRSUZ_K00498 [Eucalyptus grandis]|uniref:Uncharacterized protein n=2 Tax=Eucalyptus grandis TaxID=71139 RepID=A0ACC3IQL7_EUCGR|nr:hypothetical protein EUGRSUZ_K00498 [Eucalyptus grandis]